MPGVVEVLDVSVEQKVSDRPRVVLAFLLIRNFRVINDIGQLCMV